jgi:O-antigen ligase
MLSPRPNSLPAWQPDHPGSTPPAELALALLAVAAPLLMAWNVAPSSTVLNQALAIGGWGAWLLLALGAGTGAPVSSAWRVPGLAPLGAVLGVVCLAAGQAFAAGRLPGSLAASAAAMALAAGVVLLGGALVCADRGVDRALAPCAWGMLAAGVLSVPIGVIQIYFHDLADGVLIAASALDGRAAGNLRQPNHLASLSLWGLVALAWLVDSGRLRRALGVPLALAMVLSVVLSFSRTGTVGILLLALWGVFGRPLAPAVRAALASLPAWYGAFWWLATRANDAAAGGAARFTTQGDVSSERFAIWSNTLHLIAGRPWTGVGFGDFNFAWTLTPFPGRPLAFFDHTHNLALQFVVELGLPLGMLLMGSLLWALWCALRAVGPDTPRQEATARRSALLMLLMMATHSMLEYPLWYAYFLLPTAYVFGVALGGVGRARSADQAPGDGSAPPSPGRRWFPAAALLVALGGAWTVIDYWKVVVIFAPPADAEPLPVRIEAGKRSLFFAHHAHYAAATTAPRPAEAMDSFRVASHFLLDTRLVMAWAQAYADRGDVERARHLADRLREFRNAASAEYLAPCVRPPAEGPAPVQCGSPSRRLDDRDFR